MNKDDFNMSCPLPIRDFTTIQMSHGGGGTLMNELLDKIILPQFKSTISSERNDSAVLKFGDQKLAFTTDSYVINPIFFPGGDIGSLAVHGTINDLAMVGAKPVFLSAGFILEEGFEILELQKIVHSMKFASKSIGVEIVTGDTKVVNKGKGDKIYINTSGIGTINHNLNISSSTVQPGDKIIINGDIGRHGMAIMMVREGLDFESAIESDSCELSTVVQKLINEKIEIHCMRDLTRGGLASALVEISNLRNLQININELSIPTQDNVKGACEILGIDPIYVANEGRFICIVPEKDSQNALNVLRKTPGNEYASIIGTVTDKKDNLVSLKSSLGTERIIDMISGEQLPRIC